MRRGVLLLGIVGILAAGCAGIERRESAIYIAGRSDEASKQEIKYMGMNLLKSERTVKLPVYGPPNYRGGKVVFLVNIGQDPFSDFNHEIFVADENGQNQRRLTFTPEHNEILPVWTDEMDIVYAVADEQGEKKYYLMHQDGTHQERISAELYNRYAGIGKPESAGK